MPTRTLQQLVDEVRQRANLENADNFLTDAEVIRCINQSVRAWRDLLIENQGQDFFVSNTTVALTGAASYALSGVYQVVGVSHTLNGIVNVLKPYNFADRGKFTTPGGVSPARYRVQGANLYVLPVVPSGTLNLSYIPYFTDLATLASDTLEVFNGWEEWIILDAAMKALEKESTDTSQLFARREMTERRLISQAQYQDRGMPESVSDIYDADLDWRVGYGYAR